MDIRINLLPDELLSQQRQQRKWREWVTYGSIVLGVFLLIYAVLLALTWHVKSEVAAVKNSRLALESQVGANEQYASLQNKVMQADKLIGTALGAVPDWARILSDISKNMPLNTYLTGFNINKSAGAGVSQAPQPNQSVAGKALGVSPPTLPGQSAPVVPAPTPIPEPVAPSVSVGELYLQGTADDHSLVGEWLESINNLPYLSNVRCPVSSELDQDGHKVVHFEIKAAIASADSPSWKAGATK